MKIERGRIINDFIEPNKRQYSIPVYQRNYEWSDEQCKKLFADIIDATIRTDLTSAAQLFMQGLKMNIISTIS